MARTPSLGSVSTKLQRIAQLASEDRQRVLTSLAHHIDVEFLREAYGRTRKDGAPGVDGQTAAAYAEALEENLQSLLDRFKSGRYKAPAVRRHYIPKGGGSELRPIGIPTLEDKVLQRAVAMVLESVYEQDFLPCSYGFRPGRSAHQALEALWRGMQEIGVSWVLEIDIRSFFDALDHGCLRSFLDQRVRDGVLRRTIDKWLKAGVMEEGTVSYPRSGTPQGGVISPLLANIYLHEVVDRWFVEEVLPRLEGAAFLVRYADDLVMAFACESDARRVERVVAQRFARFGLRLHPEKTRLVRFQRPDGGGSGPGTFDFLGFTHYWGKSRRGYRVVKRKTVKSRFARSLREISQWCRRFRHRPLRWQYHQLVLKLRGHFAYYGITGNYRSLRSFRYHVALLWWKWLKRRSQRTRLCWEKYQLLLSHYPLPEARIVHSVYRT